MSPLLWGLVGFAVSVPLVLATLLVIGLCSAAKTEPQTRGLADADPSTGSARPRTNCSVPFCDDLVQVHIPVGIGDSWAFCITHGLPYLHDEEVSS